MQKKHYTIAIAGTTYRTQLCAQKLLESPDFELTWILTPAPKPIGRKKIVTPNPLHQFAEQHRITTILLEHKIDLETQKKLQELPRPDFLLVVDFGYIVPQWLLDVPQIAPLNIHPSELPKWRGSSPGQFAILFHENHSAITVMVMDKKLDHGPIIHQEQFEIDPNWNQEQYYQTAFALICSQLPDIILKFASAQEHDLHKPTKYRAVTPQPEYSPTITARMIQKSDAYVPWEILRIALSKTPEQLPSEQKKQLPELLQQALKQHDSLPLLIDRAQKAFSPWPGLWTIIPTTQGKKRMKITETQLNKTRKNNELELKTVVIEGKPPVNWKEAQKLVVDQDFS